MPARPEGEFDFKKCLRNANGYERHAGTGVERAGHWMPHIKCHILY